MIHGREPSLDDDACGLEDDEARHGEVAHYGPTNHPRMLIKPFY